MIFLQNAPNRKRGGFFGLGAAAAVNPASESFPLDRVVFYADTNARGDKISDKATRPPSVINLPTKWANRISSIWIPGGMRVIIDTGWNLASQSTELAPATEDGQLINLTSIGWNDRVNSYKIIDEAYEALQDLEAQSAVAQEEATIKARAVKAKRALAPIDSQLREIDTAQAVAEAEAAAQVAAATQAAQVNAQAQYQALRGTSPGKYLLWGSAGLAGFGLLYLLLKRR